eukprot:TRINITY_DN288_c0_g1_i1.p1 TRINITY_DN288_c0_g1~~TRINITY_DN288_c0_g1_i1.p1  ORF type:complete len:573 (+),score=179.41 TRINITY_DN288_c0_g1_i1:77-1795(+)
MMNDESMKLMNSMMSDPEILALISKPGMMEKLQRIMANPSSAMSMMNDPDIATLMRKMQSGGLTPNTARDMASSMGYHAPSSSGSTSDEVMIHIYSKDQFDQLIAGSAQKLVVADFTATWCGPCKMIAPTFASLASQYHGSAVFAKVDEATNSSWISVRGFPTFRFYLGGQMVDEFSGADVNRLKQTVAKYATASSTTTTSTSRFQDLDEKSPYVHFPLKEAERVVFNDIKYDALAEKFKALVGDTKSGLDEKNVLTSNDLKELHIGIERLKDTATWHSKSLPPDIYPVMDKMLTWPEKHLPSALVLLQLFLTHPHPHEIYSKRTVKGSADILLKLLNILSTQKKPVVILLTLRCIANLFCRRALAKYIAHRDEEITDAIRPFFSHDDMKVRSAAIAILLNYALLFRENAKDFESGKTLLLSMVAELIEGEKEKSLVYRYLIVIGTIVYHDEGAKSIAKQLLMSAIEQAWRAHANAQEIAACAKELYTELGETLPSISSSSSSSSSSLTSASASSSSSSSSVLSSASSTVASSSSSSSALSSSTPIISSSSSPSTTSTNNTTASNSSSSSKS